MALWRHPARENILSNLRDVPPLRSDNCIARNAAASFSELERREQISSTMIPIGRLPVWYFAGYSFNHPSSYLLNAVYQSIWVNCLALSPQAFRPIECEPFGHDAQLPIPRFVVDGLEAGGYAVPEMKPREAISLNEYWPILVQFFNFYGENTWLVEANVRHPVLLRAVELIDEILVA